MADELISKFYLSIKVFGDFIGLVNLSLHVTGLLLKNCSFLMHQLFILFFKSKLGFSFFKLLLKFLFLCNHFILEVFHLLFFELVVSL
jgi:hypothetical protein